MMRLIARGVVGVALGFVVMLGSADAAERLRVMLRGGAELVIDKPAATDTPEQVLAALHDAFANHDNSDLHVNVGAHAAGAEVLTLDAPYRAVSRLENDVYRSGAFGGQILILPRGSIVFPASINNPSHALTQQPAELLRRMWCGAPPDSQEGVCLIPRTTGWEAGANRSPSPYVFKELPSSAPVNAPVLSPAPDVDLPARVTGYRFLGWALGRVRLMRFARAGDVEVELGEARLPFEDGVAEAQLGTLSIKFRRAEDGQGVVVSQEPLAIDDDLEAELRQMARSIITTMRMRS